MIDELFLVEEKQFFNSSPEKENLEVKCCSGGDDANSYVLVNIRGTSNHSSVKFKFKDCARDPPRRFKKRRGNDCSRITAYSKNICIFLTFRSWEQVSRFD